MLHINHAHTHTVTIEQNYLWSEVLINCALGVHIRLNHTLLYIITIT